MTSIFLFVNGEQKGPFFPGQIRSLLAEGTVTNETPAWHEGLADWSTVGALLATLPAAGGPPPVPASALPRPRRVANSSQSSGMMWVIILVVCGFVGIFVVSCLAGVALGPITNGINRAKESATMEQTLAIATALSAYAGDHNGNYPDGSTSTEVFQKLINDGYLSDPKVFYISMPGKTAALSSHLTAENVCFDVTAGVTTDSPNGLPVVYSTGYTVNYLLGGIIVRNTSGARSPFPAVIVAYRDCSTRILDFRGATTTLQLMRPGLDLKGRTYQQLKP